MALRPLPPMLCPDVIGRAHELDELRRCVADAARGAGGVVGLVGEPGVGKTRLCREVLATAEAAGMAVLAGRCVPGGTPVPYRPLTEALLAAFRNGPPPDAAELVGFRGHLARLVPAWHAEDAGGADESPVLLGEAVVRLLRIAAGAHGCVLLLEDLHWADAESLAVVEYLGDALRDERVLVLCTARPEGAATDVLTRLGRRDATALIGLGPLGDEAVAHVVGACLATDAAPPAVVSLVATHSEGNPFLVEELLAGLVASEALVREDGQWATSAELAPTVPFSFADSIRQRLASFDATSRTVLGAAAVLGRSFDWELLLGVAEVDGRAVLDALRRGVAEQLVEVDGSAFRFRHALTREAILADLLPPERRDLATRAWPAVERANPGLPGAWCELAAELAEAAGDGSAAAQRLVESASRALASGALTSAESAARRAIRLASASADEAVADDARDVLVRTLSLAGKPEQAMAMGTELVARLTAADALASRRVELLGVLARASIAAGDTPKARAFADQARALVDAGAVDDAVAARADAVAAHVALAEDDVDAAERLAQSAIARAAATDQAAVECEAYEVLGRVERVLDFSRSMRWFRKSAELAERNGLATWLIRARAELAGGEWVRGRTEALLEARELAASHGALVTVAHMDLSLADFAFGKFDRVTCLESAQRCVSASRRYGLASLPVAELWLAGAHALAADADAMEAAAARALEHDPDDPRILGDLWGRVRATYAMVRDDRAGLRVALDNMMPFTRVAPTTTSIFPNRVVWSLMCTIDDDDHGAAARAEVSAATNLSSWPESGVAMEAIAAVAAGRAGDHTDAGHRFDAAFERLVAGPIATGSVRYTIMLAAEAAIRDGWGDPARWLRACEAFFTEQGYDLIARRCRTLLAQAGAPVPRRRGASVVPSALRALGITGREMDVLRLIAAGRSNREIAEALVLSPKTVERHITSLFDRTAIRNRSDLAAFARTQGVEEIA